MLDETMNRAVAEEVMGFEPNSLDAAFFAVATSDADGLRVIARMATLGYAYSVQTFGIVHQAAFGRGAQIGDPLFRADMWRSHNGATFGRAVALAALEVMRDPPRG